MKIHVTLESDVRNDPAAKQRALEEIGAVGIRDINWKRFERYGIISGELDSSRLAEVRQLRSVKAVEADEQRRTSD